MALVEIDDIELGAPQSGKIQAFAIDAPRIGGRNVYDVEFAGWVIGIGQPVQEIEIHQGGVVIRKAPLDQQRPDVARDYPNSPGSGTSGFRTCVSVIGLEPGSNLQLRAVLADGTRSRLGTSRSNQGSSRDCSRSCSRRWVAPARPGRCASSLSIPRSSSIVGTRMSCAQPATGGTCSRRSLNRETRTTLPRLITSRPTSSGSATTRSTPSQ